MFSRLKIISFSLAAVSLLSVACGISQEDYDAVEAERDAAIALGAQLEQDKRTLEGRVSEVEGERDTANETIGELEADRDAADLKIATLESANDEIGDRVEELEQDSADQAMVIATLEASQAELMESIGDLESLESRKDDLELIVDDLLDEIDELRRSRTPLIPDTYLAGFICTGSMNPVITCMDRAVWLDDFLPEDIVVGAVIAFDASGLDCRISSERVAHRVVDIKVESDVYYFLTQGDNNRRDDGCWIPETEVHGYMTDLIENEFPEMQPLFEEVWVLEDQMDLLLDDIDRIELEYDVAKAEYDLFLETYCNFNGSQWICTNLYFQQAQDRFDALNALVDELETVIGQYFPVCDEVRDLRGQLQALRDVHFGPSDYTFTSCS